MAGSATWLPKVLPGDISGNQVVKSSQDQGAYPPQNVETRPIVPEDFTS